MRRLAIDGGAPAFTRPLHVGQPNVNNRAGFMRRLEQILDERWLTNRGPVVREFEQQVAAHAGVRHCVTVANATLGLEVLTRALDLAGEVIVPSWTFVATAHALQWQQITPVFADVRPGTHTLDPGSVERMITTRTTGIIGVHLWGNPCAHAELQAIADAYGLELIYDAAHALMNITGDAAVTSLGRASVVSFHATKFLNTFEGGAVLTDDDDLAERVRLMTNFGFQGRDRVIHVGTNAKMSEVNAAMGLAQLEVVHDTIQANNKRHALYRDRLGEVDGLRVLPLRSDGRSNAQYVVAEIDPVRYGRTRDDLITVLEAESVLARRYFWPGCHRMEPYRSLQPNAGLLLPETERLSETVVVLPTGTAVSETDIVGVCDIIRRARTQPSRADRTRRSMLNQQSARPSSPAAALRV